MTTDSWTYIYVHNRQWVKTWKKETTEKIGLLKLIVLGEEHVKPHFLVK